MYHHLLWDDCFRRNLLTYNICLCIIRLKGDVKDRERRGNLPNTSYIERKRINTKNTTERSVAFFIIYKSFLITNTSIYMK